MYALTFLPWVGKNYHNGGIFGKKIMALGDSHYGTEQNANITREVLGWYLDKSVEREGWMNTYLKFERSLVGHETTSEESKAIWDSIAFYNYLQVLLTQPREAGTDYQYKASSTAFFQVMEEYQPDVLIVWGKRLWKKLPWEGWKEGTSKHIDGYDIDAARCWSGHGTSQAGEAGSWTAESHPAHARTFRPAGYGTPHP